MSETKQRATIDLSKGVSASALTDGGMILGRVGDDEVVVARSGAELFAIRAHCSHYRGPLVEGLVVGDTVRCPWHHACFSLRTGEALRAPALDPIACWRVSGRGTGYLSGRSCQRRDQHRRRFRPASGHHRSSSSAEGRRVWPPLRC